MINWKMNIRTEAERRKVRRQGFAAWIHRQKGQETPFGDLAEDAERDRGFPTSGVELVPYVARLHYAGACPQAVETLQLAYEYYKSGMKPGRRCAIRLKVRFAVFQRDRFRCVYCGSGPEAALEIDHRQSVVEGGTNDFDNLVTACWECNRGKAGRSVELAELGPTL